MDKSKFSNNLRGYIPPILIKKGFTDITCISPSSIGIRSVYKAVKPDVGYWIIKRIEKEHVVLYKTEKDILTALRHDFLPIVFDVFEDELALYIAMEYIPGKNFRQVINSDEVVGEEAAKKYMIQLCKLFEYLHGEGVIHKDCQPSNIMLSDQGNIYLIDFGISKSVESDSSGRAMRYASPEQMINPHIDDHRADIYSMGATIYSLLTKEIPSRSGYNNIERVAEKLEARGDISKKFSRIILKCMAQKPSSRYQSMGDVRKALEKRDVKLRIGAAVFLVLLFAATLIYGVFTWNNEVINRMISRGDEMKSMSNYSVALSHYERYIYRRPQLPYGYERRRRLLVHMGRYTESVNLFNEHEEVNFEKFLSYDDMIFRNTWVNAVSRAIQHYYSSENWDALFNLLEKPKVQGVISAYQEASVRGQIYSHFGDWEQAFLHYVQLLEYEWIEAVAPSAHIQNLLNGVRIARYIGSDYYYRLMTEALAVSHSYDTDMLPYVYPIIASYYIEQANIYLENREFEAASEILHGALQKYTNLYSNFDLLYLRAITVLSNLIRMGEDDFTSFAECVWDALAAAAYDNAAQANELRELLATFGFAEN